MKRRYNVEIGLVSVAVLWVVMLGAEEPQKGIPDGEISLYQGSVFEIVVPDAVSDPLEMAVVPRANEEMPPVVVHTVTDYMPITRDENVCVECHLVAEKEEGEPTPIPESHFIDYRHSPDSVGEAVAGARYVCAACHVEQTDAQPLVGNSAATGD